MFPLESAVLPGDELPLRVFEPRYSALVADCLADGDRAFGVVLIAQGREVGGGDMRCDVGVLAHIAEHQELGGGRYRLRCLLGERIRVVEWLPDDPYPRARTEEWPDTPGPVAADELRSVEDDIWALFERIASAREMALPPRDELLAPAVADDTGRYLYRLASRLPMGSADRYAVLAAPSPADRLVALREAVETVTAMVEFQLGTN